MKFYTLVLHQIYLQEFPSILIKVTLIHLRQNIIVTNLFIMKHLEELKTQLQEKRP